MNCSIPDIIDLSRQIDTESFFQGYWHQDNHAQIIGLEEIVEQLCCIDIPFCLVEGSSGISIVQGGVITFRQSETDNAEYRLLAYVPTQTIECLGDHQFCQDYEIKYPYMAGSMANGIASVELVEALANMNMLASFGAAGLTVAEVETAIQQLQALPINGNYCFNLIYSPNEKGYEEAIVALYLRYGISLVETSAYMKLTLPVVRYRVTGIHRDDRGNIIIPNRIIAKASRIEIAEKWFSPPPEEILNQLVEQAYITQEEAMLAKQIPMAQDLTVEADSGGHTDNRPIISLLPTMLALRDQLQKKYQYAKPLRIGAAGGIATPASALGVFAMGAAYIVTGTVNQACRESGTSDTVRDMLAHAEQADVMMAPAVDMFEMGVKLQVLKRGTMFAMRGNQLYDIYKRCNSINEITVVEREKLEKTIFKMSLKQVWKNTEAFFSDHDPSQLDRAKTDPKHKMALIFRWYLGLSSHWANAGIQDRKIDYQIWCGPAMGAFNEWTRGTFLARSENRDVVTIAINILYGAAVLNRLHIIQKQGINILKKPFVFKPMVLEKIMSYLNKKRSNELVEER